MTSCEVMSSSIRRCAGTCNSLISRWPPGCWNFHIHCCPTTAIRRVSAGGRSISKYAFAAQT
jgi:hypothetical protein